MFCLYSKASEYAIRALIQITCEDKIQRFSARDVCRRAGIPEPYSRKTFQFLVNRGFLSAVSGPGGGYSLLSDPAKTTLFDVIRAVDGKDTFSGCVLGLSVCSDRSPCSMHELWSSMKTQIISSLESQTLKKLALSIRQGKRDLNKGGKRGED